MKLNRFSLLSGVAGLCLTSLAPSLVLAQAAEPKAEAKQEVKEIVVTGSRIRRKELTSVQPIQTVSSKDIDSKGYTNIADALSAVPSFGQGVNPIGDPGAHSVGQNFVNLFNIGSQRTLTLINGQRVVGGSVPSQFAAGGAGGQVDYNTLPTALVDRIEVIQAGGAAVYGSDAIAGVINVILKKKYQGLEGDVQYGVSDRGDAESYRLRLTAGHNFFDDRINLAGSYEYNETKGLIYKDRPGLANQCRYGRNPANTGPADGVPDRIIFCNTRYVDTTYGGVVGLPDGSDLLTVADPKNPGKPMRLQFAKDGSVVPYNVGTPIQASSYLYYGGEGLNLAELTSLLTPVTRHLVNALGNFEVTDHLRIRALASYTHAEATQPITQPSYNTATFGNLGDPSGPINVSLDNPYLSASARATLASALGAGVNSFSLFRASRDIFAGNPTSATKMDTLRTNLSAEGDFDAFDRNFYWSVSGAYGRTSGAFKQTFFYQSRFLNAIDAISDGSGKIVCRDPAARAAGCQPLNLFGDGAPSDAAKRYISDLQRYSFANDQTLFNAYIGGEIVKLPAGPLRFSAGFEYRDEQTKFNPNAFAQSSDSRNAAMVPLKGSFNTKEWYVEATAPVIAPDMKIPLVHRLELDGAYRTIDNSIAGDDEAWSYGVRWYPVQDLMLRGQAARSFRAPALLELFLQSSTAFENATDPCDSTQIGLGPNPSARAKNCLAAFKALGLGQTDLNNFASNVMNGTAQGTTGGNRNLKNEIADQTSYGLVYQPHQIKNLAFTLDYVRINLSNAIVSPGLTSLMASCYDNNSFPNKYCATFNRRADGQVKDFADNYLNAGYMKYRGVNFGVTYQLAVASLPALKDYGNLGNLGFKFDLTNTQRNDLSNSGTGQDLLKNAGALGYAKIRWNNDITYSYGPARVTWTTQYTGSTVFLVQESLEARSPREIKPYYLNNVAISYDITPKVTARLIVNNVFDVAPSPNISQMVGYYDMIGRTYAVGLNAKF